MEKTVNIIIYYLNFQTLRAYQEEEGVYHFTETKGAIVSANPRRRPPDKFAIPKKEFWYMLNQEIFRSCKSCWLSPLHKTSKKNGEWWPCGDYHLLNVEIILEKYPLPHLNGFAHGGYGKIFFCVRFGAYLYSNFFWTSRSPKDRNHNTLWTHWLH